MASQHVALVLVFVLQTSVGTLGNYFLLFHYISLSLRGHRVRATDVILKHLTIANSLVILSRGVTQTMAALGVTDFLSDMGCKLVFYLHRVGRGVSMGTICLLSVCQMVTISPWTSRWAQHKDRAAQNTEHYTVLTWILSMSLNLVTNLRISRSSNNKNITNREFLDSCSATFQGGLSTPLTAALFSVPDWMSLGLMTWASGSMVSMLHRHKQQVQHLHRARVMPRAAPETRATQSILVLVSTFVTCYALSSTCHLCIALSKYPSWWMVNLSALLAASFPTVSPFLLMSWRSRLCGPCRVCVTNTSPQCRQESITDVLWCNPASCSSSTEPSR
ncbi:vomeronasal type-1 receptor 4-like [Erinaceus europaeus]|uniref:Vomeronasal type-1 receptor n=1 Tax=Erinaceus europaeus TaxID=9365 RepID=A0A1S3WW57_ERIEU|nr:vomeronasal type-1 receptor 4-like [Erinaceus europaeus]